MANWMLQKARSVAMKQHNLTPVGDLFLITFLETSW